MTRAWCAQLVSDLWGPYLAWVDAVAREAWRAAWERNPSIGNRDDTDTPAWSEPRLRSEVLTQLAISAALQRVPAPYPLWIAPHGGALENKGPEA